MLLDDLAAALSADADRQGEYHIACPECGHESSPKAPHCSFNAQGWHCFVCDAGGGLTDLAKRVGLNDVDHPFYNPPVRPPEAPRRTPVPDWMLHPENYLQRFEAHPQRLELWGWHKGGVSTETVRRMRLGVGALPLSRCPHERLIVPIFDGTMLLGLRGRSLAERGRSACDCTKWLQSLGTTLERLPLYNAAALRPGCVVWIVENCVDALLITERTPFIGVAVYSTSYWRDEWLETLREARPEVVMVALDNDLVGNGGALRRQEFERLWFEQHPQARTAPQANGVQRVNRMLASGLPARLYDWGRAEHKADIGSVLCGAM